MSNQFSRTTLILLAIILLAFPAMAQQRRASANAFTSQSSTESATAVFRAARDLSATVSGEEIQLERGERVGMNFQYAYTTTAFRWLLHDHGGLEILQEYSSPDARFLTAICRK